jgi:hypothetical protein
MRGQSMENNREEPLELFEEFFARLDGLSEEDKKDLDTIWNYYQLVDSLQSLIARLKRRHERSMTDLKHL